jgi:hypothetical protein
MEKTKTKEQALPTINEIELPAKIFLKRRPVAWVAWIFDDFVVDRIPQRLAFFHHILQEGVSLVEEIAVYDVCESPLQISFESLRWFSGHFQTILQNRSREELDWKRCQNQSKVFVDVIALLSDSIANDFQLRHP